MHHVADSCSLKLCPGGSIPYCHSTHQDRVLREGCRLRFNEFTALIVLGFERLDCRTEHSPEVLSIRNRKRTVKPNEHARETEERHTGIHIQGAECFVVVLNGNERVVHSRILSLRVFAEHIPDGAVEFGAGWRGTYQLYRFPDGAIHDLRIQAKSTSNNLVPLKPAKEKYDPK
jgi:hypothetical protein